ncbi:MAG: hypothetical protein WCI95_04240 [bacterium]
MQKEKTSGEPVRPGKNYLIATPINPGPNKLISVSRLVDSTKKAGVMRAWLGAAHVIVLLALVSGCRKDVPPAAGPGFPEGLRVRLSSTTCKGSGAMTPSLWT